jgi:hypothetical protein
MTKVSKIAAEFPFHFYKNKNKIKKTHHHQLTTIKRLLYPPPSHKTHQKAIVERPLTDLDRDEIAGSPYSPSTIPYPTSPSADPLYGHI